MATGGFKPNATTDFLEEWKAKREKMRAKMLGDIAAATGAPMGASNTNSTNRHAAAAAAAPPPGTEFANNPERSVPTGNCLPSSYSVARSSSGSALKRPEEETHHHPASPTSNLKKTPPQPEKAPCASPDSSSPMACNDSDKESPSPSKAKEKNSSGPSARKGKGQIEKRKLREKRRSTGVVSIPSNEVSQLFVLGHLKCKKKKNLLQGKTHLIVAVISTGKVRGQVHNRYLSRIVGLFMLYGPCCVRGGCQNYHKHHVTSVYFLFFVFSLAA